MSDPGTGPDWRLDLSGKILLAQTDLELCIAPVQCIRGAKLVLGTDWCMLLEGSTLRATGSCDLCADAEGPEHQVTLAACSSHTATFRAVPATPPAARATALVERMNLTEKILLLSGVWGLGWGPPAHPYVGNIPEQSQLGIPWLSLQDGPQGYREGRYGHYSGAPGTATQWPSGLTVGATWDRKLAFDWGRAMGAEFRTKGANCQLGPGLNLARVARGGRNFEYLSGEDPVLGAQLVPHVVAGIQSNGVIATAK